jgi:hypothetical protein
MIGCRLRDLIGLALLASDVLRRSVHGRREECRRMAGCVGSADLTALTGDIRENSLITGELQGNFAIPGFPELAAERIHLQLHDVIASSRHGGTGNRFDRTGTGFHRTGNLGSGIERPPICANAHAASPLSGIVTAIG